MGYDVLSSDLFDDSKKKPSKKKKESAGFAIKPIYIHIGLIIIIILGLLYFFIGDIDFGGDSKKVGELKIVGDIKSFNETYLGDLNLYSASFILETGSGIFEESSKDVLIENFNGRILYDNNSIVLSGNCDSIEYGKNKLTIKSGNFTLTSKKKTRINIFMDNLTLDFIEGNLKLDDMLSHDFEDSIVDFKNFNLTMTYDGTFTFLGYTDSFVVISPDNGLKISYEK